MTSDDIRELLLEHGNEIVLLVDLATQEIRAANGAAARHLGYTRDELIGRPITDIECALTDIFYWEDVRQGAVPEIHNADTSYLRADGELLSASKTVIRPAAHPGALVVCAIPTGKLHRTENELADTGARLRATLEATADGILLLDRGGAIVNMNRQFARIWQIPDEPLLACDDNAVFDFLASCMRDPQAYRRRLEEIRPDSDEETYDLLTLDDGRYLERKSRPAKLGKLIIGRVFSFTDISENKARESRLKLAASVFSHAHEGIVITDAEGNIVDVNTTFSRITGYTREEAVGQNPRFLKSGRQSEDFYRAMWSELVARGHWEGEVWNRHKNGRLYAERLSITAVQDVIDASLHYVALISDITELKEHQQRLERMAHYDALTGVPNRVLLADRLNLAIAQARRHKRGLALVYLDIDGFKEVNDIHGHETGDQLLITLAHRLRDALREGDTLARLGGDEFVAVLTDLGGRDECELILTRLLNAAATPIDVRQNTFQLSASLGVTLFPQDGGDADTLLRHADQAMYQAKQAGKNRYHLFDPEKDRQTRTHHQSLDRIAQAIAQDEFELYFQPKVNMRTGGIVGAEALLRWRHPERGMVLPGDFLPLIEDSEHMARLDDWVLNAALAQMAAWHARGLDIAVGVNISAHYLQQADFLPNLEQRLAAYPTVRPDCLELEVVETAALEGITRISSLIEGCQALGVHFSLDDFGTGYSSLTYLRRLPANVLKIDQSFVRDMLWDSGDLAIVEGIIGLAAAFRRTVIAEGVETAEHGELLLRLGCDLAQGYGIARPMPAGELPAWIATWRPPAAWSSAHNMAARREELPLTYAEVDHRNWFKSLENFLSATQGPPPETGACRFGEWYLGVEGQRYAHLAEFAAVGTLHRAAHETAEEIVALVRAGNAKAAQLRLAELRTRHEALIDRLHALSAAIAVDSRR
jgi:diguanylate cyclase (GGDEF)-like protein/PAS domain S-box-containing protein